MERGDQRRGMALDARVDAATISLEEVHDQQVGRGEMHMRDRQLGLAGELSQHVGLKIERHAAGA